MRTNIARDLIGMMTLAALLTQCGGTAPVPTPTLIPTEEPKAFELVVLHTNDVRGYTEPCG